MEVSGIKLPAWQELPDFGLYLDQVISLTTQAYAEEPLVAPEKKKYSRAAMAQLLMISFLKQTSSMDGLRSILHPADGVDTEAIYGQFIQSYTEVSDFLQAHPELSSLECAIAAAVCQTACAGKMGTAEHVAS